jgi:peptidoglycan-associated lipoprotein
MLTLRNIMFFLSLGALTINFTACKPEYPNCETDEHCAEQGQVCVGNLCKSCRDDSQCTEPGKRCSQNECVYRLGYCDAQRACPGSQKCRDNKCGPQCLGNNECDANEFCDSGSCATKPECGPNADKTDCAEGYDCVSGRCKRRLVSCSLPEPIYFDFRRAKIKRSQVSKLESLAECFKAGNVRAITLAGHADEPGDEEYNIGLGQERAEAVQAYLKRLGASDSVFSSPTSYGENRPAVDRPGRQPKNRRVTVE